MGNGPKWQCQCQTQPRGSSPASKAVVWHNTDHLAFGDLSIFVFHCVLQHKILSLSGESHMDTTYGKNLTSCLCASGYRELSRGGKHLWCVKHFLILYTYSDNTVSVPVRFLFHCFFLSVDCYLNIRSLPFPLRRGGGKVRGLFGV